MKNNLSRIWKRTISFAKKIEIIVLTICIIGFVVMFFINTDVTNSKLKLKDVFFYTFIGGTEFIFYALLTLFYNYKLQQIRKLHLSISKIYKFSVAYIIYFSFIGAMLVANIILTIILSDKRFLLFFTFFIFLYYLNRPISTKLLNKLNLKHEERQKLQ